MEHKKVRYRRGFMLDANTVRCLTSMVEEAKNDYFVPYRATQNDIVNAAILYAYCNQKGFNRFVKTKLDWIRKEDIKKEQ